MKYRITVTERLERIVDVEAESESAAIDKVESMYREQEIVLGAEDMCGDAEFGVIDAEP